MEKRVISLLGGSFFLLIVGVVLYLWSLFKSGDGSVAGGTDTILLIIVGAVGLNVGWVLHDVVERLMRLERGREGEAEPKPAAGRLRE
jgi:hypothetical protein